MNPNNRKMTLDSFQRRLPATDDTGGSSVLTMIKFVTQSGRMSDCSNLCTAKHSGIGGAKAAPPHKPTEQPMIKRSVSVVELERDGVLNADVAESDVADDLPVANTVQAGARAREDVPAPAPEPSDAQTKLRQELCDALAKMSELDVELPDSEWRRAATGYFDDVPADYGLHKSTPVPNAPVHRIEQCQYMYFDDEILRRLEELGWNRKLGFVRLIPMSTCVI